MSTNATSPLPASTMATSPAMAQLTPAPRVRPEWFYATDTPKLDPTKLKLGTNGTLSTAAAPNAEPQVWERFDAADAARLEHMYQRVAAWRESAGVADLVMPGAFNSEPATPTVSASAAAAAAASAAGSSPTISGGGGHRRGSSAPQVSHPPFSTTVMLGDDQLFEVDIDLMVRYPLYWPGPLFEVRRSTWFANTGPGGKYVPVDAALNRQVEQGYQKIKPWQYVASAGASAESLSGSMVSITGDGAKAEKASKSSKPAPAPFTLVPDHRHPLFGPYLSKYMVYLDDSTAMLRDDSPLIKLQLGVISAASAIVGPADPSTVGTKLIRGHDNLPAVVKEREAKLVEIVAKAKAAQAAAAKASPAGSNTSLNAATGTPTDTATPAGSEPDLTRSALSPPASHSDLRAQLLTPPDYPAPDPQPEFDHLLLVVHGIGAKLSEKMESISFVADVNNLRQGINQAVAVKEGDFKDKRIKVLPIHWRQAIQFATQAQRFMNESDSESSDDDDADSVYGGADQSTPRATGSLTSVGKQASSASDLANQSPLAGLADAVASSSAKSKGNDPRHIHNLPALDEIMLTQVPAVRTLVSDVVLDVLLYMSPRYRAEIIHAVARELNRVYTLFCSRHPNFAGRTSIFGHSLGSIICTEILSSMPATPSPPPRPNSDAATSAAAVPHVVLLRAVQSHGNTGASAGDHRAAIAAAAVAAGMPALAPPSGASLVGVPVPRLAFAVDCFFCVGSPVGYFMLLQGERIRAYVPPTPTGAATPKRVSNASIKRPQCRYLFNIFSHYDPVAVRIEPLVSRALVSKDPKRIPYHKGGLTGAKQAVENTLSRTYNAVQSLTSMWQGGWGGFSGSSSASSASASVAGSTDALALTERNVPEAPAIDPSLLTKEERRKLKVQMREKIDGIEVLNARYKRIDFALQQGVLENPYLAALSTHMSYWSDLDVAYFVCGELVKTVVEDSPSTVEQDAVDGPAVDGGVDGKKNK
ncbi:DDHD domain-domain-containing protein [Catenaria anguillulae PL171]|uniref:DDHD domain-domain-containing protein n=1 Tax=Catenaria anguillulae PL171 TaxID=765915 RepID=A0A1Y2I0H5_9FUNG|nr:DDHD domain-domain-containing protein [Catenaria anguillulae PL171]